MIHDQQVAEAAHPVGKHDGAGAGGNDVLTLFGANQQAAPGKRGGRAFAFLAEFGHDLTLGGHGELAAKLAEVAGGRSNGGAARIRLGHFCRLRRLL